MTDAQARSQAGAAAPPVIESLQVLRALAALMVVMLHVDGHVIRRFGEPALPQFVQGGYIGVDVFFCLSGFIMYYTMHRQFGVRGVLGGFLRRRFLRIYPIYWLATGISLLVGCWEPRWLDWGAMNPVMVVKSLLLVPQGVSPVLHPAWTLVHEVKFYGLFGCTLLLPWRKAAGLLGLWGMGSAAVLVLSVVDGRWLSGGGGGRAINYLLHPANLEFLAGILAAWVLLNVRTVAWLDAGLLVLGVVWAGIVTHGFWELKSDTKYHAIQLFALPSFLIVLGATLVERRWRPSIPRWLVGLGDASYSTYLFHELIIQTSVWRIFPSGATPAGRTLYSVGLLAGILGLGYGIFRCLEAPVLRIARGWLPRARTVSSVGVLDRP